MFGGILCLRANIPAFKVIEEWHAAKNSSPRLSSKLKCHQDRL